MSILVKNHVAKNPTNWGHVSIQRLKVETSSKSSSGGGRWIPEKWPPWKGDPFWKRSFSSSMFNFGGVIHVVSTVILVVCKIFLDLLNS